MTDNLIQNFDTAALYNALDEKRIKLGLSWNAVAKEIWDIAAELNRERPSDHPFSPSTIKNRNEKHRTSCMHGLVMLHWLNVSPECFLVNPPPNAKDIKLPKLGSDRRPRWSLKRMYQAANQKRQLERLSWSEVATILGCSPNQLTGLKSAKFATNINLAMRIVQWTGKQSTDFMYAAKW